MTPILMIAIVQELDRCIRTINIVHVGGLLHDLTNPEHVNWVVCAHANGFCSSICWVILRFCFPSSSSFGHFRFFGYFSHWDGAVAYPSIYTASFN